MVSPADRELMLRVVAAIQQLSRLVQMLDARLLVIERERAATGDQVRG